MKQILSILLLAVVITGALFAAGGSESGQTTTITVIHYMGEQPKRDGLQTILDAYMAEHPGVEFEVTAVETSNYLTTLRTMVAAGDTPDIMFGKPKEMVDFIEAGHLADLSGAPFLQNLAPGAVPSMVYEGGVYGVPIDLQTIGVFYNKTVFAEYGLQVPTTWSEFIAIADTLQANGVAPFAHPYADSWTVFVDYFADEYVVRADYPDMYSEIEAGNKTFADYPHFQAVLERLQKRASYNAGDDWGTDNSTAQNMFATGKAGMYVMGSWAIGELVGNFPEAEIGYFPIPVSEDPSKNLLPIGVDDAWMASASSDHLDVVLDFFKFMTEPESAIDWMTATNTISFAVNIEGFAFDPISQEIVDLLNSGMVTNFHAPVLFSSALEDVYRNMIVEAVASGSTDFAALIVEFDDRIDEVR